jgi:hypothetical protein
MSEDDAVWIFSAIISVVILVAIITQYSAYN